MVRKRTVGGEKTPNLTSVVFFTGFMGSGNMILLTITIGSRKSP